MSIWSLVDGGAGGSTRLLPVAGRAPVEALNLFNPHAHASLAGAAHLTDWSKHITDSEGR